MVKPLVAGSPYSTILPLVNQNEMPNWIGEADRERVASYFKYDDIYWSVPDTFKLQERGEDEAPIYIPNARTIVDTTAFYYMKGLKIDVVDPDKNTLARDALKKLLTQTKFYSTFHDAKHAGVARGDYVLHVTADPEGPEGERISIDSVLPHTYFPRFNEDPDGDPTEIERVYLAQEYTDESGDTFVRRLHYYYGDTPRGDGTKVVFSEEGLFKQDEWDDPLATAQMVIAAPAQLPDPIDTIPVYHFKNQGWDGEDFGSSELRGFERIMSAVNQAVSDEEMALALEGLGVYATDAQGPVDEDGNDMPWEIAPARVMEVPTGSFFKRVEGVGSIKPSQDHIKYLDGKLTEASGTSDVALGNIDVQTANSGIALAIKFMPTQAKLEERDIAATETLTLLFLDWQKWHASYESDDWDTVELQITIGEKLPTNRTAVLNELNNMHDRNVISDAFYRSEMTRQLGYVFPDDIAQQIIDEIKAKREAGVGSPTPDTGSLEDTVANNNPPPTSGGDPTVTKKGSSVPQGNQSNNASRPNESGGTEAQ